MTTQQNMILARNTPWKCGNCKTVNTKTFLVCLECKHSRRKLMDTTKLLRSVESLLKTEKALTKNGKERLTVMKGVLQSAIDEETQ